MKRMLGVPAGFVAYRPSVDLSGARQEPLVLLQKQFSPIELRDTIAMTVEVAEQLIVALQGCVAKARG